MPGSLPRLVLKKNQDRRVRGGHPWVFSNEVGATLGSPADGGLVEIEIGRASCRERVYVLV